MSTSSDVYLGQKEITPKLLYLSYNFLYKNQLDSFTIFPGLCREVYFTGQYVPAYLTDTCKRQKYVI